MSLAAGSFFSLINQAQQSPGHEPPGLFPYGRALDVAITTPFCYRMREQDKRANHFITVLNRVGKTEPQLGKILAGFLGSP